MNIHELGLKVKEVVERGESREIYTVLLITLVGFSSFALGRLSKLQESRTPVLIHAAAALSTTPPARGGGGGGGRVKDESLGIEDSVLPTGGQLVASQNGTKYHFPWCSGAARIAEANKVWFGSVEEAQKAGYTPASNCKGLK